MPIFEYRCQVCHHDFELLIRGVESGVACPACGSEEIFKKFSRFGFKTGGASLVASSSSSCGGCSSHNCSGCHHH